MHKSDTLPRIGIGNFVEKELAKSKLCKYRNGKKRGKVAAEV